MPRYEWRAYVTFQTNEQHEEEAREACEVFLNDYNKNPDGPRIAIEEFEDVEEDGEES